MKHLNVSILFLFLTVGCNQNSQTHTESKTPKTQIIPVGKGPDALFLTPNEEYLYVANVQDTFISVIDTRKNSVAQTIDGVDYPWGFTRLGNTNLVAVSGWDTGIDVIHFTSHEIVKSKRYDQNLGGITSTKDGTISIINTHTKTTTVISTGGKPELIHANEDNSQLYISNFFENKIHILDTETDKIVQEISGLDGPEEVFLSKSGETLYVVNFNISKVFSYDAKTCKKQAREFVAGAKPIGVVSVTNIVSFM